MRVCDFRVGVDCNVIKLVMGAIITRSAPLETLDIVAEKFPGLKQPNYSRNGWTELISLEHSLRQGFGPFAPQESIEPDAQLRASIHSVVSYLKKTCGLPSVPLSGNVFEMANLCKAYYVLEAILPSLEEFSFHVLFTRGSYYK